MEESANFIPLGLPRGRRSSNADPGPVINGLTSISARGAKDPHAILAAPRRIGATPAERKAIAREIRLAAKKIKKKAKADAKRARKENAILHRRMTRNNEKYSKNKERNKERDIMLERQRIRFEAVRQAERLAAIHDPTGKMFNVGEVVVMPDGQVKSKEALARAAEARKQKEIENEEKRIEAEQKAKFREEKLQARREGREAPTKPKAVVLQGAASVYGNGSGQPSWSGQQLSGSDQPEQTRPVRKISKKQQQRQELLRPKPPPPKPIIPEDIALPEGEEKWLDLWDITDEEITRRLSKKRKEKIQAGKDLRKIQKEQKKFNRAMKVRKKQAANAGVIWDPEKAKKEILGEMEKADWGEKNSSDSESEAESDSEDEVDAKPKANGKNGKVASSDDDSDSSSSSDSSSDSDSDTDSDAEAGEEKPKPKKKKKKGMPQVNRPKLDLDLLEKAAQIKQAQEDKKRNARLKRRAERRQKAAEEAARKEAEAELARIEAEKAKAVEEEIAEEKARKEKSSKKRKRSAEEEPELNGKKVKAEDADDDDEARRKADKKKRKEEKRRAKEAASNGEIEPKVENLRAEDSDSQDTKLGKNWNTDALSGDEERKAKYLRLLGAKKESRVDPHNPKKETPKQKLAKEREEKLLEKLARPNVIERKERKRAKRAARKAEEEAAEAAAKAEQLAKVQSDLERQYEAGMKLKHDGGSKRRGLGA